MLSFDLTYEKIVGSATQTYKYNELRQEIILTYFITRTNLPRKFSNKENKTLLFLTETTNPLKIQEIFT